MKKRLRPVNVVVEVPLPDGWLSMFVGEEVNRNDTRIKLRKASWISDTGRRYLFFAGTPDDNIEVEPYPDDVEVSLPLSGAVITSWPYDLPRGVK